MNPLEVALSGWFRVVFNFGLIFKLKLNLDAFDSSVPNFRDRQHMLGVFLHGV